MSADGSNQSDGGSQCTDSVTLQSEQRLPPQAPESVCTDTESIISSRQGRRHHKYSSRINGHLPRYVRIYFYRNIYVTIECICYW